MQDKGSHSRAGHFRVDPRRLEECGILLGRLADDVAEARSYASRWLGASSHDGGVVFQNVTWLERLNRDDVQEALTGLRDVLSSASRQVNSSVEEYLRADGVVAAGLASSYPAS